MSETNITIKDIAKLANVGISTVSRVMNNHPDVGEDTRKRVSEIIKQYNYVPNSSARNLKLAESNNIGILIKGVSNPFFSKMIATIEARIVKKGYAMVLQQVGSTEDEITKAESYVKEKRLAGIIFLGGSFSHTEDKIKHLNCPFVFVTSTLLHCGQSVFSSVYVNDTKESFRIVSHLIGLGHRKIAILAAELSNHSVAELRLDGYKQALTQFGVAFDENRVIYADEYSMKAGYGSMGRAIGGSYDFTAVFAISDLLAVGAAKALLDAGLRIPADISLVGFDGQEVAFYYEPTITTISQPVVQMANKAADQLFRLIRGGKHKQFVFDGLLVEGQSCTNL